MIVKTAATNASNTSRIEIYLLTMCKTDYVDPFIELVPLCVGCSADGVFIGVCTFLAMLSIDSPSTVIDVRIADVPTITDVTSVETLWEGST